MSAPSVQPRDAARVIAELVDKYTDQLNGLRRDLHAHPELSWGEDRTCDQVVSHLEGTGWDVRRLDGGGVIADLGSGDGLVALRADLDALPVDDLTTDPWASTVPGAAHACGHDVHTAGLVGAGLALAEVGRAGLLSGRVRLLFQPAEEVMPGGAKALIAAGALEGVERIYALHCDPTVDVGQVGLRVGPLTGASDAISITLAGRGGHTSRPHLTEDLTYALGVLVTQLPSALSRRLDPRAGASLVWGAVHAGDALNVIPARGRLGGTLRMLDASAWHEAENLVRRLVRDLAAPYGVTADVEYVRGVPPVVNDKLATGELGEAVTATLGASALVPTSQSLGGEDFAWYAEYAPIGFARLGTDGGGPPVDLHRSSFDIDERALSIGVGLLARTALRALADRTG